MTETTAERRSGGPGLYLPFAGRIYDAIAPHANLILRVALGLSFIAHGWGKLMDPGRAIGIAERVGFVPATFWGWMMILTEVGGGVLMVLGLWTRVAATAMMVFMAVAITSKLGNGYFAYAGGWELDFFYLVIALKYFSQGPGAKSLDARLAKTF